jgi:hypothetical protein
MQEAVSFNGVDLSKVETQIYTLHRRSRDGVVGPAHTDVAVSVGIARDA